jgi:hypothetical protein
VRRVPDMSRAQVVYQTRCEGGGIVWVRRRRGGWRAIQFDSAPTAFSKLLGLCSVLARVGGATTTVVSGCPVVRLAPVVAVLSAAVPRAGPALCPVAPQGP